VSNKYLSRKSKQANISKDESQRFNEEAELLDREGEESPNKSNRKTAYNETGETEHNEDLKFKSNDQMMINNEKAESE
jgi:hypothetical protein